MSILDDFIPAEYQLLSMIVTGVLGFLLILSVSSSLSAPKKTTKSKAKKSAPVSTPTKKIKVPKGVQGSVSTPEGRRSTRIASRRE
ncbi:hypothetical protein TrVE_jg10904 [Triparma verrucosa]|uniref:Uncharacterized protein n=2 Tax=Triparma TaxID=722752 RepID=A0A9W7AV44_9STRA|nr:hypothetical protein TrST_g4762 [Triparma strigata]GMI13827.1 hypothetical protein TrVE_jg10904 [Triparma verrucosa]